MENERKITKEELKNLIETMPEGTIVSITLELKEGDKDE